MRPHHRVTEALREAMHTGSSELTPWEGDIHMMAAFFLFFSFFSFLFFKLNQRLWEILWLRNLWNSV